MTTIINLQDIKSLIPSIDVVQVIEEGFVQYSKGKAVVPPVAELLFDNPPGDVHIKYGYIKDQDYYCIKIASGFYKNTELGVSSSQGMMLLFNQKTGQSVAVLLDEGYLTDIRTAAAGGVAAKYFAPKNVTGIGIIGTGIQARLQLELLMNLYPDKPVWVWGRNEEHVQRFVRKIKTENAINISNSPSALAKKSNLIVTTTPSETPLLHSDDIQPGTHITAVGSDTKNKQELDSQLLKRADLIIADSISQSKSRGEIYQATRNNLIAGKKIIELGDAIQDRSLQRTGEHQISITDLTGVAVQDIMIATAIYTNYAKSRIKC